MKENKINAEFIDLFELMYSKEELTGAIRYMKMRLRFFQTFKNNLWGFIKNDLYWKLVEQTIEMLEDDISSAEEALKKKWEEA